MKRFAIALATLLLAAMPATAFDLAALLHPGMILVCQEGDPVEEWTIEAVAFLEGKGEAPQMPKACEEVLLTEDTMVFYLSSNTFVVDHHGFVLLRLTVINKDGTYQGYGFDSFNPS